MTTLNTTPAPNRRHVTDTTQSKIRGNIPNIPHPNIGTSRRPRCSFKYPPRGRTL
jgi:hypothetical protein